MKLDLTAQGREQELVLAYLEENASETLAEKINNGVRIQKGAVTVINKKTLNGFFNYANQEARKLAAKGANSACIEDCVVYGWAIHYFEEEGIEEKLFLEDGSPYSPSSKKKEKTVAPAAPAPVQPKATTAKQISLFEFGEELFDEEPSKEVAEEVKAEEAVSPLYKKYMDLKGRHPDYVIAMRVGDFYEVFGEDAYKAAKQCSLTIVSRDFGLEERVPMVGFPFHKEDVYRNKLKEAFPVAIVENENDAKFYFAEEDETSYRIDTETGELMEESKNANALIQVLFDLLKGDLEVRM